MKNVQISEILFNKLYAYFVDGQTELEQDIKQGIEEKAEKIYNRYEYSKHFLDDKKTGA